MDYNYKTYIDRWKQGLETGLTGKKLKTNSCHIRRYIFEKYNSKCAKCGWSEINPYTKTIPLELEHIDGNHLNMDEENLTLLCPNCHSLTPTATKGANKGNGRKFRKNGRTSWLES